jgi:hypothetical protein
LRVDRPSEAGSAPGSAPLQYGAGVWRGADLSDHERWTWHLTDAEIDELLTASTRYVELDTGQASAFDPRQFPLTTMAESISRLRQRLTGGPGFELVRGLPIDRIPAARTEAIFAGIGAHLGVVRRQNAAGDLLGHVRDVGADPDDPTVRIYQTNQRQTFHTDSADVVGLLCLQDAQEGGDSLLVSVGAVYNEMLARDRALATVLFGPIATDRRGEVPPDAEPYFSIPVLSWFDDSLTVMCQRQYIESAQRFDAVPPLSTEVVEALDLFDSIMDDPDVHLRMRLGRGDKQFVHNHSILHDRTSFLDRPGSPRHLLRLWLSVPGDRRLPPVFAQRFGSTDVGDRGGV